MPPEYGTTWLSCASPAPANAGSSTPTRFHSRPSGEVQIAPSYVPSGPLTVPTAISPSGVTATSDTVSPGSPASWTRTESHVMPSCDAQISPLDPSWVFPTITQPSAVPTAAL